LGGRCALQIPRVLGHAYHHPREFEAAQEATLGTGSRISAPDCFMRGAVELAASRRVFAYPRREFIAHHPIPQMGRIFTSDKSDSGKQRKLPRCSATG
jgi:hypothetical protein